MTEIHFTGMCLVMSQEFNDVIALDLHQVSWHDNIWFPHVINEFTRFSECRIIKSKSAQTVLDSLSELDERVVAGLESATSPPPDLLERTTGGVEERLRNEASAGAFLDLFTIGWTTVHAVLDPTPDRGSPHDGDANADETMGGS